jgi:urease accessory protein
MAGLGGGLLGGDHYEVRVDVEDGATAFLTTQSATKVYGSERACSQRIVGRVDDGATLAVVPDPVVCFAGAKYRQSVDIELAPRGSLALFDGYTCGRSARGEKWRFASYAARSTVRRASRPLAIDATRLEPNGGPIADRMGPYEVWLTLLAFGASFERVRSAMLHSPSPSEGGVLAAPSAVGSDGAALRVAAECFEVGARVFRPCFDELAQWLGDDPFARKW